MAGDHIQLSLAAERDLDALFDYIAMESGIGRAEMILRRIQGLLASLASSPNMGRVRADLDTKSRSFSTWPWVVLYEPLSSGRGILVVRVMDGRRDLSKLV